VHYLQFGRAGNHTRPHKRRQTSLLKRKRQFHSNTSNIHTIKYWRSCRGYFKTQFYNMDRPELPKLRSHCMKRSSQRQVPSQHLEVLVTLSLTHTHTHTHTHTLTHTHTHTHTHIHQIERAKLLLLKPVSRLGMTSADEAGGKPATAQSRAFWLSMSYLKQCKYSGECYNEHRCYNERGGILSADVARACAWRVGPSRFD
jgi:hypothetical protein